VIRFSINPNVVAEIKQFVQYVVMQLVLNAVVNGTRANHAQTLKILQIKIAKNFGLVQPVECQ
jgi:hypothetical protein